MAIRTTTLIAHEQATALFQAKDYDGAFKLFSKAAHDGFEDSAIMLAEMYYYGKGVKENRDQAFKYYSSTGETYIRSCFMLAYCYYFGIGTRKNDKKSAKWLEIALSKPEAVVQCTEIANNYYYGKKGFFVDYAKAFYLFGIAAERGNLAAICGLGLCHEKGNGTPLSIDIAIQYYQRAIDARYAPGALRMAALYRYNTDNGIDYPRAIEYYAIAQSLGSDDGSAQIEAMYQKGLAVPDEVKDKIVKVYQQALAGNSAAMYDIGNMYLKGRYFAANVPLALKWLNAAIDAGNTTAMVTMGIAYAKGTGVPVNPDKAAEYYRRAADQGDKYGQYNLGMCYRYGKGTSKDYTQALLWFTKAAESGHLEALSMAEACIAEKKGIDPSRHDMVELLNRAEKNDPECQYKLGMAYMHGDGTAQVYQEAFNWFLRAANLGYADAQFEVGCFYYSGKRDIFQNLEKANYFFKEAAKRGHPEATFNLGVCYYNGAGVEKNEDLAIRLFKKAASLGSASAVKILAKLGIN